MDSNFKDELGDFIIKERKISDFLKILPTDLSKISIQNEANIILIGFPFDDHDLSKNIRIGVEKGPITFKKGLKEFNCFFLSDTKKKIELYDGFDLCYSDSKSKSQIILEEKLIKIYQNIYNSIPFLIGGGIFQSEILKKTLLNVFSNSKIGIISVGTGFNIRDEYKNFYLLQKNINFFYQFALQGTECEYNNYEFLLENKINIIWLEKDIRHLKIKKNTRFKSQAGQYFNEILDNISKEIDYLFISFEIDSINSCYCPGVSNPSVIGLNNEEVLEIFYRIGMEKKVIGISLGQFNPAVENNRTRRFLNSLLYNFILGINERK